jgi:hypothetical protein
MVDRKLLVGDWNQIEQALCDMEKADRFITVAARENWWREHLPTLVKGGYRALWHIFEYLCRRDKA